MKGQEIVVSAIPNGKIIEGIISGTPKPGTHMQVKNSVEPVNGRHTWETYAPGSGDGSPRLTAILNIDHLQGKTYDDAYVTGTRCFLYIPAPGDEVNVRKANLSGTGTGVEDLNIGERMLIVDGTGMVSPVAVGIANTSFANYPYTSLETVNDQQIEMLIWCMFTGMGLSGAT